MTNEAKLIYDFFYVGQELPPYTHTVTGNEIDNFCKSFNEKNPIYLDDVAAREVGFVGRIAPPMMVRYYAHFQNVFKGFRGMTIPGHSIHTSGEYHFFGSVQPGDTIITEGEVIDKYIKKDKKFISFELISKNQRGEIIVINRHTSMWPK